MLDLFSPSIVKFKISNQIIEDINIHVEKIIKLIYFI